MESFEGKRGRGPATCYDPEMPDVARLLLNLEYILECLTPILLFLLTHAVAKLYSGSYLPQPYVCSRLSTQESVLHLSFIPRALSSAPLIRAEPPCPRIMISMRGDPLRIPFQPAAILGLGYVAANFK